MAFSPADRPMDSVPGFYIHPPPREPRPLLPREPPPEEAVGTTERPKGMGRPDGLEMYKDDP